MKTLEEQLDEARAERDFAVALGNQAWFELKRLREGVFVPRFVRELVAKAFHEEYLSAEEAGDVSREAIRNLNWEIAKMRLADDDMCAAAILLAYGQGKIDGAIERSVSDGDEP